MKISANYGEFRLVPEGTLVLKIVEVNFIPKGKPKSVEVNFEDPTGAKLRNNYTIEDPRGMFALTLLNKFATQNEPEEFDPSDMVGQAVLCEVVHNTGNKPKDDGTFPVFANIKKVLDHSDGGDAVNEVIEDAIALDEEDGFELLDDEDDDELPF